MKKTLGIAFVVTTLAAGAALAEDITDYLPNGTLFDAANPSLEMKWDVTTKTLIVQHTYDNGGTPATVTFSTATEVDRIGRLAFVSTRPVGSNAPIDSIDGTLDIRPNDDHYTEYNVQYATGVTTSHAAWSTYDGISYRFGTCDCSNGIATDCITNDCHALKDCTFGGVSGTCQWTSANLGG